MGFFNFHGKKDNKTKKKSNGIKKQIMEVLSPKAAAADYYANPKKKSNRHPKNKSKNKKYK
tara:strand:- start:21 stop:203 length:183 start_codon:yes stop_codon:yes gene_type:complete